MPATTPNGVPYVLPADHPLEYPALSQQLANMLDSRLGPMGESTLTNYGAWTLTAGSRVARRAGWVSLYGVVTKASAAPVTGEQIAWLPSGWGPTGQWFGYASGAAASGGGLKIYLVSVDSTNAVKIRGSSMPAQSEALTLNLVYPHQ